ncbi:MAG: TolC family protein [Balneolaceae bacterium]
MKWYIFLILKIFLVQYAAAQNEPQSLTLQESYDLVQQNYPLAGKAEIQRKITELNRNIAKSGWYPDVQIRAETSYQSDVIDVPFAAPGTNPPEFSHDHYNLSLDINQSVFDGGRTRSLIEMEEYSGEAEQARIESEMRGIRSQVDQVYFGILMMIKQEESLQILIGDIQEQLEMVRTRVRNGVLLPGDELVLRAEQIKAEQRLVQIQADIRAGYDVLGELVGIPVSEKTVLELPGAEGWEYEGAVNRPEYDLFAANKLALDSQKKLTASEKIPSFSLFARTAYGRPGLNAFDDELQLYWIVGVRAQWSFKSTRNATGKAEVLSLQQRNLDADRDAFTRQLNSTLHQTEEKIEALEVQLKQDEEVLELRTQITAEKRKQLEQGSITSTEYITELNAENLARIDLELRRIQRIKAISEYETQKGISWN